MSRVSTYLNFQGKTEEAFRFYEKVFGTEIQGEIARMESMVGPDQSLTEAEKQYVGHIELPILAGHVIMGTDMVESMGQQVRVGNNTTINLELDSRDEAERIFGLLSEASTETAPLMEMPWGLWGCTLDRFGIRWMFNCPSS